MKDEERDLIKETPTKEESKIQKYVKDALVWIFMAFLVAFMIIAYIRKSG
jgi:hypothetical protein